MPQRFNNIKMTMLQIANSSAITYDAKAEIICAFTEWLGLTTGTSIGVEIAFLEFNHFPPQLAEFSEIDGEFFYTGENIENTLLGLLAYSTVIANTLTSAEIENN